MTDLYFEWLRSVVEFRKGLLSYEKLYQRLFETDFIWYNDSDMARAKDGESLRREFLFRNNYNLNLLEDMGPVNCLEVMVAMSMKLETNHMSDDRYGNRTGWWFWSMLVSLGLSEQHDDDFNEEIVDDHMTVALTGSYDQSGEGGFFTVRDKTVDMRTIPLWDQMQLFSNERHKREEEYQEWISTE